MTITYAQCRDYEEGESFPYYDFMNDRSFLFYPCSQELYECWQPDCIEDEEFNLVIMLHNFPVRARGIHFDFVEK